MKRHIKYEKVRTNSAMVIHYAARQNYLIVCDFVYLTAERWPQVECYKVRRLTTGRRMVACAWYTGICCP